LNGIGNESCDRARAKYGLPPLEIEIPMPLVAAAAMAAPLTHHVD
jgi:hypothetical protein